MRRRLDGTESTISEIIDKIAAKSDYSRSILQKCAFGLGSLTPAFLSLIDTAGLWNNRAYYLFKAITELNGEKIEYHEFAMCFFNLFNQCGWFDQNAIVGCRSTEDFYELINSNLRRAKISDYFEQD